MNKQEAMQAAWTLYNRYPSKRTSLMTKLEDYGISVNEFNDYDSTMAVNTQINTLEERAKELEDIPGYSQVDTMSDAAILSVFEARDELKARKEEVGRPPADSEWYQAGLDAEQRIPRLRDIYENKKAEEWEQLGSTVPLGMLGAPIEIVAGWADFMPGLASDFGERFHERGLFSSWNPLTGFGAWDIAEFNINKETGQRGFSKDLLEMEDILNDLYGSKREYQEEMREGGYRDVYGIEEEIASLNQLISEHELIDPRILGETR